MPRTKLDKFRISKPQVEARIIKSAMGRNGIYTNRVLAEKVGTDPGYLSRGFRKGFSHEMKLRMHKVLRFTQEEIEVLGGWSA